MGVKRTYLLWLWMQTAWNETFSQGDSYQVGLVGSLGAAAFDEVMTNMKLDFPMLTIAEAMKYNYTSSGLSCYNFYEDYLGMDDDMTERLCT